MGRQETNLSARRRAKRAPANASEAKSRQANVVTFEPYQLPTVLTQREAAEFARVTTRTIATWIAAGKLKGSKLGDARQAKVLVLKKSLLHLLGIED